MILFSRKNLCYDDYKWTAYQQNDLHVSGKIDQTNFNRLEGNEMIYLINKLMIVWEYRFASSGNKMEKLIREQLPEDVTTQEDVQRWLREKL